MKFSCRFCGDVFDKDDISVPMDDPGWVWMRETCPRCGKGMDDWYVSEIWMRNWIFLAIRHQRNVKVVE